MGRWFRRGVTKVKFVPVIAATTVDDNDNEIVGDPTQAELDAGVDITKQVAEVSGWQLTNSPIPTPNLADRFTPQIEGEDTVADSSLTFYDDDDSTVIRDAQAKGTEGYIVFAHKGFVSNGRLSVFPVRSAGDNDEISVGNDPARYVVGYAVTAVPNLKATHPVIP